MVDDVFYSNDVCKEYLNILNQIEEYCSRGPEIDLPTLPQAQRNGIVFLFYLCFKICNIPFTCVEHCMRNEIVIFARATAQFI